MSLGWGGEGFPHLLTDSMYNFNPPTLPFLCSDFPCHPDCHLTSNLLYFFILFICLPPTPAQNSSPLLTPGAEN